MIARVKAKFTNGHIVPLERLDIEEGAEVVVAIENATPPKRGLVAIAERVRELHKDIPPEEWDALPTDLAMNKKHYLYGHPKEEGDSRLI